VSRAFRIFRTPSEGCRSALTNKLLLRVTNYFDGQIRIPAAEDGSVVGRPGFAETAAKRKKMTDAQMIAWYSKMLESGRLRHRRLHRFARALNQRFCNAAEYSLEGTEMNQFLAALVDTDHFLVYTKTYMEDGLYVIASPVLREQPDLLRRIVTEAFYVQEIYTEDGSRMMNSGDPSTRPAQDPDEDMPYVLVLAPQTSFFWPGLTVFLEVPRVELALEDGRLRLIADGSHERLELAKEQFMEVFLPIDEDGEPIETPLEQLPVVHEARAHLPAVHRELRKISRMANRLAESTLDSVHHVRAAVRGTAGHQELLELWFAFASDHGQHAQKYMDRGSLLKFNRLLVKLAISWVSFICDDCDPNDRKTFRWAVNALEFALHRTRRNNILHLPDDQFELLRQKVASCMTLLISHFDILGARSTKEKERQEELLRLQSLASRADDSEDEDAVPPADSGGQTVPLDPFLADKGVRAFAARASGAVLELEKSRTQVGTDQHILGRVLEDKPENRSLMFLASSSSNIAIRWQQGRFIGAGAFGSVYLAVNLDSGSLMAVKEIKFQELSGMPNLYSQIKDELAVMEMLHHPNVVEYYGIEVHRDKVYIFEEYCQGGSLADLLAHGRIEDEGIIQVYTLQLLEGLAYLHSQGIVHRDIKPDNVLLDHNGVIKYVDFGAAKVLAKNHRTMQRTRRAVDPAAAAPGGALGGGLGVNNSLTGTPMYMSPEVIKNDKHGRRGAMDVWSLGCVVLEFATGRKPWSNLDNEWAIMFHIGVAREHPPLPEPHQLSSLGIDFVRAPRRAPRTPHANAPRRRSSSASRSTRCCARARTS
jgi:mitogen-activated protein kinase kinase kinase